MSWAALWAFISSWPKTLDLIRTFWNAVVDFLAALEQSKRNKRIDDAIDKAKKPDKTLEEAADAACAIEQHFNPGTDCADPDRIQ